MARQNTLSRFEINKQVRRILSGNGVNMREVQISASGRSVNLSGSLLKDPSGQLTASTVSNIAKELFTIPGISSISSDLENWDINGESIKAKGDGAEKEKKAAPKPPAEKKE